MALGQQQLVVTGVLHQPIARLRQPLLQAGERPGVDSLRQRRAPLQDSEVVSDHAQPQPHLVGPEPMAAQPRQLDGLFAFLDPLLFCPPLIVEPHHVPAQQGQIAFLFRPQWFEELFPIVTSVF